MQDTWKGGVFLKKNPGNKTPSYRRQHVACGNLEAPSEEQHHCSTTALPSAWLARVPADKRGSQIKRTGANSILNFIAYAQSPNTHICNKAQQQQTSHLFVSIVKWADSQHCHNHPINTPGKKQASRIDVLCTHVQCQQDAERNKASNYWYCKLNPEVLLECSRWSLS